ncbi:Domain of unknown function DUF547 [Plasmopara halstedii]|uniref:Uncharacterized protein n=1 Tax=Plasmopara halstedii TaxID=4781 RepID=A0A0P1AE32_PLAHL|nr:Domain of unknown function DUF547 [Plasmopara halstedii]CEG39304.1 Domain of unknown function DUF547 [Plasmopara halstedii]|eukprot:XP_024575673.1 Domain of unknown function DUF547 [Plasmopara halstedii]
MTQSKHRIESLWRLTMLLMFFITIIRCLTINAVINLLIVSKSFVFPSGDVTIIKVLWLIFGLVLAGINFYDLYNKRSIKNSFERHQLYLLDKFCSHLKVPILISHSKSTQVQVESSQFRGQVAITATWNQLNLSLQGEFLKNVAPNSQVVFALEVSIDTQSDKGLIKVAKAVVNRLCGKDTIQYIQGGIHSSNSTFSILSLKTSSLGVDCIGSSHTFEGNFIGWRSKLLFRLYHLALEWLPINWIVLFNIHIAAYLVSPPSIQDHQTSSIPNSTTKTKQYLFCFLVQGCQQTEALPESNQLRVALSSKDQFAQFEVGSPIALHTISKHRRCGIPRAHAEACRQIAEDARALRKIRFSLDVWVEFVDRIAGRRKVGYLFKVVDTTKKSQCTVMRSAVTVKNAVLLLRLEHEIERKEREQETGVADIDDSEADQVDEHVDLQNLSVESRTYRYELIEHETAAIARILDQIALKGSKKRYRWCLPQRCYQNQLEAATLYRCLMSPSQLPSVPSYQAIGVQLTEFQRLNMKIVDEIGIYRQYDSGDGTIPLLRQEWLVVSADNLHFFRSYSASPSLSIPVTNVLDVCAIDCVSLLQGHQPSDVHHEQDAVVRWFCLEIHLVFEVITLYVETLAERDHLITSLHPLTITDCGNQMTNGIKLTTDPTSFLFSPMSLASQSQPICLNQRTSRFVVTTAMKTDALGAFKIVQESLEAGLKVFALGETVARLRTSLNIVRDFLRRVEQFNYLDLEQVATEMTSEDRYAMGLNLYHTLFIHTVLVFGYPQNHEQWKLAQTVPCYLMRKLHASESVRYTLADIQRIILRCPVPVDLGASSFKRSLSQHALMDVAIGGGDAINGLCRAVLGVAWTPVLPRSTSYTQIKTTPQPISTTLAIERADLRTSLVLQINSSPPISKTLGIMRVYEGRKLNAQLNSTCTMFLKRELRLNEINRMIYLPRVCDWYRIGYQQDADDVDYSSQISQITHGRRRRSSSGSGLSTLPTSRGFYCLQRLLSYMELDQHDRAMHLLLGAGDECRFVFSEFWTRPSRSAVANMLTSAGNTALSVLISVTGGTSFRQNFEDAE